MKKCSISTILLITILCAISIHLWYKYKFEVEIAPYTSTEHAISTWPSTATTIGVQGNDEIYQFLLPMV
jgi:hypothetical protein